MMEYKNINFGELVAKLREKFDDGNLFLTFLVVHTSRDIGGKRIQTSTFAKDNIDDLKGWTLLMQAKLFSGSVMGISIIVRVFLKEKIDIIRDNGKIIKIPKKEIYHFFAIKDSIHSFNKKETYGAQNTDHTTKKLLLDEPGVIIKSSEKLLEDTII